MVKARYVTMDKFDDIEAKNARAWDEETLEQTSPRATLEPISSSRQRSNATISASVKRKPRVTSTDPRPILGSTIVNSGRENNGGRSTLTPLENQHYKQRRRPVKGQIVRKVEWSKQNAVNTKRKQDYLDREAENAAKTAEFLGVPTENTFSAEGYYFWSDNSINVNSLLGNSLELFDDVRATCEVFIDFVEAFNCIRLRAKSRLNIENGIAGIRAKIQHARADAASHAPIYIVETPAVDAMRSKVSPIFLDSPLTGKQRTIIGAVLDGSPLDAKERATWEFERQAIIKYNQDRFSKHVVKALAELGPLKKAKKMRSIIGKISLFRYRKGIEKGYSFPEFSRMMGEISTQGKCERIIHEVSVTGKILDRFRTATSLLEPTGSLISHLADVMPKHSLVIIAHGPSRQSIRVEADIDMIQCPVDGKSQKGAAWQIGSIKYYHYGHNSCKTRLAIGIVSLECKFDSSLEITTEEAMSQPPEAFQKLIERTVFETSGFATEYSVLNYPTVRFLVPEGIIMSKVLIRSALHYKLQNTSYIAEVAVYQAWSSSDTRKVPVTNCGVSFYHKDWDLLMTPDDGVDGPKALDVRSLFPDESDPNDGISSFLAHVQRLQWLISVDS